MRRAAARMMSILPDAVLRRTLPPNQRPTTNESILSQVCADSTTATRLFIGPTNSAGQGWHWSRAAEKNLPDVAACSMRVAGATEFGHQVDQTVQLGNYRWSHAWRRAQRAAVTANFTHVIIESGRPLFSDVAGDVGREIRTLQQCGIRTALLFHGTDIRLPSRHALAEALSPYREGMWNRTASLQVQAEANMRLVDSVGLPMFISTPDLFLDLPGAQWLPVVVDPEQWRNSAAPLPGGRVPLVVHAPSNSAVKGSDLIDPVLQQLDTAGVISYRRVVGVPASQMPAMYRDVDVVLDQFRIGNYGVAVCEALAAGRIVVSHVSEFVRGKVAQDTGLDLPVVEASAGSLEAVLRAIFADPDRYRRIAATGPQFVDAVHDGRRSAEVLGTFLN